MIRSVEIVSIFFSPRPRHSKFGWWRCACWCNDSITRLSYSLLVFSLFRFSLTKPAWKCGYRAYNYLGPTENTFDLFSLLDSLAEPFVPRVTFLGPNAEESSSVSGSEILTQSDEAGRKAETGCPPPAEWFGTSFVRNEGTSLQM